MQKVAKILSVLFFLGSLAILLKVFFLNFYMDFGEYYFAAKASSPYLNYPPVALSIFSFFTPLPLHVAEMLWASLSLAALFAAVFIIFKTYQKPIFSTLGFLILGLVCFSFPVKFTLGMGQVNHFVLLLFVTAIYFLNKKKGYLASFLLAFAFTIKLFPAYLLLHFVLTKRWKLIFAFVISLILLSAMSLIFINWKTNLYFYQHFLITLVDGWKTDYYNQSLTGFVGRLMPRSLYSKILIDSISLVFILSSCLVVYKSLKNKLLTNMGFGLLITLNLIVNNFSWQHHFVFLIFPFLATLFYLLDKKYNWKFLLALFTCYALIAFNLKDPHVVPVFLQSHVLYGTILLWSMECYLIWKDSQKLSLSFPLKGRR
jgi:alpha-1,2-mannosyltransferase